MSDRLIKELRISAFILTIIIGLTQLTFISMVIRIGIIVAYIRLIGPLIFSPRAEDMLNSTTATPASTPEKSSSSSEASPQSNDVAAGKTGKKWSFTRAERIPIDLVGATTSTHSNMVGGSVLGESHQFSCHCEDYGNKERPLPALPHESEGHDE